MSSSTVINFEERKKRKRNHVGDSSSGAITNLSDDSAAITTNASVSSKNIDGVFNENSSSREDNPMIEIFHLHNCFRNAIQDLQDDCAELEKLYDSKFVCDEKGYSCCDSEDKDLTEVRELEGTIAGRFQVIWSVFAAHSKAEDEFIWPALKKKLAVKGKTSETAPHDVNSQVPSGSSIVENHIDQEEYEEDHADEERMFRCINELLKKLKMHLKTFDFSVKVIEEVRTMVSMLSTYTGRMAGHLKAHLAKEEESCLPLVEKHLDTREIHDLVGSIMGKRSSQMMSQILSLAVQNLPENERVKMMFHMKEAMTGTFFERWLDLGGWLQNFPSPSSSSINKSATAEKNTEVPKKTEILKDDVSSISSLEPPYHGEAVTPKEMEKLIKTIAANPQLSAVEKNATIQKLRDSVWNSNKRRKKSDDSSSTSHRISHASNVSATNVTQPLHRQRSIPPTSYYKARENGEVELIWNRFTNNSTSQTNPVCPLFSAGELASSYHDGGRSAVLGCPHYSRSCKLRHPSSGRLYTCRLCCDQAREQPTKENDSSLDRYAVSEVFCMRCGSLQPAGKSCVNPLCESQGRPFAKYHCSICNLYDDDPGKTIYHCPFCNVCRLGSGLGVDFRHCMRCNACVSIDDKDHKCIPSSLQGKCPVCYETMFESREPLRGLRCGHIMHLSCFNKMYLGSQNSYTCPLCKKSIEDMTDTFRMLDSAVRMQPMPHSYASTFSKVYCQDCCQEGLVQYHFVGLKCDKCGSYNTRYVFLTFQPRSLCRAHSAGTNQREIERVIVDN